MLSYPKTYPVQIKVVGLITCDAFQRLKCFLQLFYESYKKKFLPPQIRSLMEFDWMEYITSVCIEVGGKSWSRKTDVVVFWNNHLIGDDYEFHNTLAKTCQFKMYWPLELSFEERGKQERNQYFNRDPDKSYIFFDIIYDDRKGRLVFELYSDLLPKTCTRFMELCLTHPMKLKNVSFQDSIIKRVCKNGWLQGGDLNIPYKKYKDESYAISHDRAGVLSLCNSGKNTNGTQFFITFKPSPWMDGFYVAIGQLLEGYYVLSDLKNFRTTYEQPDTEIMIRNCGVLPYGRGLPVRNEFVKKISKEIATKWKKISSKIRFYKHSSTAIEVREDNLETENEFEDVDSNNNYLIANSIKHAPDRMQEQNVYDYILSILIDLITKAVQIHDLQSDIIDLKDVSSEEYYFDRYVNDLYSRPMSTEDHLNELIYLCSSCNFFGKAKRLKDELSKSQIMRNLMETAADNTSSEVASQLSGRSRESEKKIQIGDITTGASSDSILKAIDAAFKNLEETKVRSDEKEDTEGMEFIFDPAIEIIEELLTRITGEKKSTKQIKEHYQMLTKDQIIRQISIKLVKSILIDALKQRKRSYSTKKKRRSILKTTSSTGSTRH